MNLILLFPSDFISGSSARVLLSGRRHAHVLEILKPRVGDALTVGVEGGRMGLGHVVRMDGASLELQVTLSQDPPAKLPVILCVALMRPIALKRVLQTAAAVGVREIHLFHSRQVEKSFWQSSSLKPEAIRHELVLGLEQAKDTVLPAVHLHQRFKRFVQDDLPALLSAAPEGRGRKAEGIVADPSGDPVPVPGLQPLRPKVLVVGPEGGFIPYEVDMFRKAGCRVVGLGARILKVETAIITLLAKIV